MAERDSLQSRTIDYLRFPLTLMVIFIHQAAFPVDDPASIGGMAYKAIYCAGSLVLSDIAVPMFFFFSGYLYFFRVKEFGREVYFNKTKKRIKSLFLPYIYWNLIAFVSFSLVKLAGVVLKGKPIDEFIDYLCSFSIIYSGMLNH